MNDIAKSTDTSVGAGSAQRPTWVRWQIVAVLLAFSFMSWFNRVSMSVAYDEQIKNQIGISETAIGWVYSAFLIVYMLGMTPGGWFADRFGPWRALVVMGFGSAMFCAMTGAVGFTALPAVTVLALFLVIRGTMGGFTAPIYPASGRIYANWIPSNQRAAINGVTMAAALLGIASTYYGFGKLMDWFTWPVAFVITGTMTAVLAVLWGWFGRNYPSQHPCVNAAELQRIRLGELPAVTAEADDGWRKLLTNRSLILITLSYAAVGYFEYLFYFWMHYYFDDVLHLGKDTSRLYSTILFLAMAAGMILGGVASDLLVRILTQRRARAVVVVTGMLAGAVFLGLGIMTREPRWIVVWFALAMAAVGATEGPFWATAIDLGGRRGGTSAGIFNTGGNAGGALAPIVTPLVSKHVGWQWAIALGSIVCIAGVVLWFWIDTRQREDDSIGSGSVK